MNRKLSIAQNTMFNTVGSCFYLVCQWLITVLVVRLGSVEYGGILSLSMSVTNIFFTLSTFGIHGYQVTDYKHKFSTGEYITTRLFTCSSALVLCIVYNLVSYSQSRYETACIIVYMLFRIGEALSDENHAIQQVSERMDYICWSFIMRGILLISTFAGTMILTHDLLTAIGVMTASTMMVVLFYEFPVCKKLDSFTMRFSIKKTLLMLRDNWPLMANSLLMVLLVSHPRTRLNALWGSYWMGIYGSVAAPAAIVQSVMPWLYNPALIVFARYWNEKEKKGFYSLHRRMVLLLCGTAAAAFIGAALLGHWGLNLLFGEEIAAHDSLLLPTLATTTLIAVEYYLGALLTVARKLKSIVAANAAALAVTFLFSDMLIRPYGPNGVNLIVCISMSINCIILYILLLFARKANFSPVSSTPPADKP